MKQSNYTARHYCPYPKIRSGKNYSVKKRRAKNRAGRKSKARNRKPDVTFYERHRSRLMVISGMVTKGEGAK